MAIRCHCTLIIGFVGSFLQRKPFAGKIKSGRAGRVL
jgi:hypothetical protein